jgi:hypothetical protein
MSENFERLDNIEMQQKAIENILKTYKPSDKPMDRLSKQLGKAENRRDGKSKWGFVKIIKGL